MLLFCIIGFNYGCSTIIDAHSQKESLMETYTSGNFKEAAEEFAEKAEDRSGTGDELMWRLEEGTVLFDADEYKSSINAFKKAEKLIKDYDNRASINVRAGASEVGSAFTNLNALPYKGFNYDRILLNTYKALDYFAIGDKEGALVELRRMHERQKEARERFDDEISEAQKEIDEENQKNKRKAAKSGKNAGSSVSFDSLLTNPRIKKSYSKLDLKSNKVYSNFVNPFSTYLSAIGYLADDNYGEAVVDFRNLYNMLKKNPLIQRDLVTCAKQIGGSVPSELSSINPYDYSLSQNIVYVIFANGMGPFLKQVKIQLVLPFVGYTGFAYPEVEFTPAPYKTLCITDSGNKCFNTVTVGNMDPVVAQEYRKLLPIMITRIAISTISKEIASYAAVRASGHAAGIAGTIVAYIVTGIYKYTFNTADTRCWQTLPKEYQIAHLPRPTDGKLTLKAIVSTPEASNKGQNPAVGGKTVKLSSDKKFTIIYVKSPTYGVFSVKVFEIK